MVHWLCFWVDSVAQFCAVSLAIALSLLSLIPSVTKTEKMTDGSGMVLLGMWMPDWLSDQELWGQAALQLFVKWAGLLQDQLLEQVQVYAGWSGWLAVLHKCMWVREPASCSGAFLLYRFACSCEEWVAA